MIRAGRTVLTAEETARRFGYALTTAKRYGVFETLPQAINQHGPGPGRRMLWDEEQVTAVAQGLEPPEIPADDHPDDLLDQHEAAALWNISEPTWDGYRRSHPHLLPEHQVIHGVRFWRRGDLESHERPGKGGGGAGRPAGTPETSRRSYMSKADRLAQLVELENATEGELSDKDAAEALGISESHIKRIRRDREVSRDQT